MAVSFATAMFFCFMASPGLTGAPSAAREEAAILDAAESVFLSMSKKDSPAIWRGLSAETKQSIVRNIQKAVVKEGRSVTEEEVRVDLETGGRLALDYWGGYLSRFEPKIILEESRWSLGEFTKDRGEIILRHKKSDYDARLKMYREEGAWKVGLDETFSPRNSLKLF